MSAISSRQPRADDPRVVRTRAAVLGAARTLFLAQGYAGTTMEEIAALAGLTKRTIYNNYGDKDALFREIAEDTLAFAGTFVEALRAEFADATAETLPAALADFARRMALGVVREEVVAIRRLLIGESRGFPDLAAQYFERAPGQVMDTLAARFAHLADAGLLRLEDPRLAAAQFSYLIMGEALDRAVLTGQVPPQAQILADARDGVATFLARYGPAGRQPSPPHP